MILAVDPGIAHFGWAIVAPRTGEVVACGALVQPVDEDMTKHADRERRTEAQAALLGDLVRGHGVQVIAAEEMSFAPQGSAASKIGIGLSWGSVIGVQCSFALVRRTIPPKTWQRAIVPAAPGEKRSNAIDYKRVYDELKRYVDCDRLLADVAESHRNHALDACGVGVYAALVTEAFHVKRKKANHG